jgi:GNAT superfamily N-acetyltransferase
LSLRRYARAVRYDDQYEEHKTLRSGREVRLRAIRPEDKAQLREGFERLGPRSRYTRFFTGKKALHDADLVYLTEVDGFDHVALVAGEDLPDGQQRGLGVARFVRCADDREVAEPAIAIVDDAQGEGLGGLMLRCLTEAAVERGVRRFRCPVLAHNDAIQALLAEVGPHVVQHAGSDGVTLIEMTLPEPPVRSSAIAPVQPDASGVDDAARAAAPVREPGSGLHALSTAVHRLLGLVARQAVSVPFRGRHAADVAPPAPAD